MRSNAPVRTYWIGFKEGFDRPHMRARWWLPAPEHTEL
jgi:hypothetical protein